MFTNVLARVASANFRAQQLVCKYSTAATEGPTPIQEERGVVVGVGSDVKRLLVQLEEAARADALRRKGSHCVQLRSHRVQIIVPAIYHLVAQSWLIPCAAVPGQGVRVVREHSRPVTRIGALHCVALCGAAWPCCALRGPAPVGGPARRCCGLWALSDAASSRSGDPRPVSGPRWPC